jgi:GTP-binding protein HflX
MTDSLRFIQDTVRAEKGMLIACRDRSDAEVEERIREMRSLARTLGIDCSHTAICRKPEKPHPASWLGKGKVEELRETIAIEKIDTVLFEYDLSPVQQRNLEEAWKVQVIDRTWLILLIFGRHAISREGKLQVELAQLSYLLPRLSGSTEYLSRLGGTIGTKGPGEQKLEIYRRRTRDRIHLLSKKIQEIEKHRTILRQSRERSMIPEVTLLGYTNAGKSTILNTLTETKDAAANNRLFATLDPLTRIVRLSKDRVCLVSDTVGVLANLPHTLIAAFRTTLEQAKHAKVLITVYDTMATMIKRQITTVSEVVKTLEITTTPTINVFNKIDLLSPGELRTMRAEYPHAIFLSAKTGAGIEDLKLHLEEKLYGTFDS